MLTHKHKIPSKDIFDWLKSKLGRWEKKWKREGEREGEDEQLREVNLQKMFAILTVCPCTKNFFFVMFVQLSRWRCATNVEQKWEKKINKTTGTTVSGNVHINTRDIDWNDGAAEVVIIVNRFDLATSLYFCTVYNLRHHYFNQRFRASIWVKFVRKKK